jgi:hypothetical protein
MADVEKRLLAAEKAIAEVPADLRPVLFERESYFARIDGARAVRSFFGGGPECHRRELLMLSGEDVTGAGGKFTINLANVFCPLLLAQNDPNREERVLAGNPHFVATPHGEAASILTTVVAVRPLAPAPSTVYLSPESETLTRVDADVTVFSWAIDGSPAPRVRFAWHAIVPVARAVHFA